MLKMADKLGRFRRSYWAENWRRTWSDWEDRQALVAFAVLVLTMIGFGVFVQAPLVTRLGLWAAAAYVGARFLVGTPLAMWNDARKTILEDEARAKPRLALAFDPVRLPYLQELYLTRNGTAYTDRRFRVGIINESNRVIRNVRVVLESFEQLVDGQLHPATPDQAVLIEHGLNVMGRDDKSGLVDVAPGDRPTAFADLVVQPVNADGEGDWMSPCYASGHFFEIFTRANYVLGLRVEGGGTYSRMRLVVGATLGERRISANIFRGA